MTRNMYVPSFSIPSAHMIPDMLFSSLSSSAPFSVLGMDWVPDGQMRRWCCCDERSIGWQAQDTCTHSLCLHKDTFQITLSTVQRKLYKACDCFPASASQGVYLGGGVNLLRPHAGILAQLGTTNPHIYQIGLSQFLLCFWCSSSLPMLPSP